MRQTFADEIVNAGYGLHPETVVIKIDEADLTNNHYIPELTDNRFKHTLCQPIFDFCFVQINEYISKVVTGAVVSRMSDDEDRFFFQVFLKHPDGFIAYLPRCIEITFFDGCFVSAHYSKVNFAPTGDFKYFDDEPNVWAFASLEVFELLHNKAEIELVTPSRQVSRQMERKTGKKPSPYFEIKIDPTKPQKRYTSTRKTGRSKNAHIVRGNFATYTEEAPLFGRLTGTFFRPAHARGVTDGDRPEPKNYRIILPKDES